MRFIHRIGLSDKSEVTDTLRSLGISFNALDPLVGGVWFDIDETHPGWPELERLLGQWQASNIVRTEFNSAERENAKYLEVSPTWHQGYPQPEDDFGYQKVTYDLKNYCPTCGVGKKQITPFRLKGEPKWGKKHILQLNWVFDEYFVLPVVWKEVFQPLDIGCTPVLDHRSGSELQTVVQLDVKLTATSPLSMNNEYPFEMCGACGRKKYLPISRGFFPAFANDPLSKICRTQEYFGSGASAWNAIVVDNAMYKMIQGHKLTGVTFVPLES